MSTGNDNEELTTGVPLEPAVERLLRDPDQYFRDVHQHSSELVAKEAAHRRERESV